MAEVLKSDLSAVAIGYSAFLRQGETSALYELVASNPWRMLKSSGRTVVNLVHNLPDCLGDEGASPEELPFDLQLRMVFDNFSHNILNIIININ